MFIVIFESITPLEAQDTAGSFYGKLQPIVETYSGFISEEALASTSNPEGGVTIAKFEDEAAAQSWRNNSTHLRIQKASREKVFTDYRIRVGQVTSPEQAQTGGSTTPVAGSILTLLEETKSDTSPFDLNVLCSGERAEGNAIDVASYKNDEKTVHVIGWASENAASEFIKSEHVAHCSSKLCVQVTRDYTKTRREQAP